MGIEGNIQVRDLETIRGVDNPQIGNVMSAVIDAIQEARENAMQVKLIYVSPAFHHSIIANDYWYEPNDTHGRKLQALFGIRVEICTLIRGMGFIIR